MASLLAAITVLYSSVWMYTVRRIQPKVELGFNRTLNAFDQQTHSVQVNDVLPGSPAERAGLRVNDRIVAINLRPLDTSAPMDQTWSRARPGDPVTLTVLRPGEKDLLVLHGVFRAAGAAGPESFARSSALQITGSFPVLFFVVGFTVLFLRLDDPNAWLLALLFCAFVAAPDLLAPAAIPPRLHGFVFAFRAVFFGMLFSFFYIFFAVFPARSPLDRRLPWLKWLSLALGVAFALSGLRVGDPRAPQFVANWVGSQTAQAIHLSWAYAFFALGLVSLAGNAFASSASREACRKSRVILWGTLAAVVPILIERAAIDFAGYRPSFWLDTALILVVFLYPLSFAYAVVKHRVMEMPVLLKRSARYLLVQRGFVVLLLVVAVSAIALFTRLFSGFFKADFNVGMGLSVAFGSVLAWASASLVKRGTERIDRAFFRSAYDARVILQDLAAKARTVSDRRELAALLERHLNQALHPKALACYLEGSDGRIVAEAGAVPPDLKTIPATLPALAALVGKGLTWDALPPALEGEAQDSLFEPLNPECLVPILGRDSRPVGLLVLGERRSEEPYSREDKRLLDSAASQAGIALENIRLAEKMAERIEADRRAAIEMDIARQVQARLFPQMMPPLPGLEYAGGCIQARQVGGDYYDFLDLGPGRLGIVLADISGKGISGALLMANLQANLRSQYAVALDDLPRLLRSVNRVFHENTPEDSYATLFFADYDDATRRLRYANCGHNPPLLLRADAALERLGSTATVLGLFGDWDCETAEVVLNPGDLLVIYTDGITEARDAAGHEFGEDRLVELLRLNKQLPVNALLASIHAAVQQFSGGSQADDLTLVVARAR